MRRPYRTYGMNRQMRRKNYTPKCTVHPTIALKLGHCVECDKIAEAKRIATIKAQPDCKEYVNWDRKVSYWSPSYMPLFMILLDKVPEYVDATGTKHVFQFGSSSLAGSHGRTVEEVRKHAQDMLTRFPQFNWQDIRIAIVSAPCVWDCTIIHEVIEVVEVVK